MDKDTVIEIIQKYSEAVNAFLPLKKVILFGSYSRNEQKKDSDIDVALIVDTISDDYLTLSAKLFSIRHLFDLRIEPILFEEGNDPTGFLEEISKNGILIYSHS